MTTLRFKKIGKRININDKVIFDARSNSEKVASKLCVPESFFLDCLDKFNAEGTSTFEYKETSIVYVRSMFSAESIQFSEDNPLATFKSALDAKELTFAEPIIFWDKHFSAIDVDVKEGYEFNQIKLLSLEGIPTPAFSWVTKSGGLRLIYIDEDEFTAEEIAAVAYLCLVNSIPYKNIEVKNDTRHPAYETNDGCCGEVVEKIQRFDASYLRRWLKIYSAEDTEVKEWLTERGLELGKRYPHSKCPLHPERESHGDPVIIFEQGVYCFSCESYGDTFGSNKPGFFPFTAFCSSSFDVLYNCMKYGTHWAFAKFVFKNKFDISEKYAKLIYSAGLLLHDWDRSSIHKIMTMCPDLIRIDDHWTNINGEMYVKNIRPTLSTLMCCKKAEILTAFEQSFDLTKYGYPSLQPIFGCRINPHINGELTAIIQNRNLSPDSMIKYRPIYTKNKDWSSLDTIFPGLNKNFLKLLIAARGIMEGAISMPPMIFVTGPTGSGKSLTVFLAASICGDRNTEIVWTKDVERVRQAIVNAKAGSFVTFNEIIKETSSSNCSLDFILNLTPDSVSHYIYTGPVRMGRLPVLIWTDTELPLNIRQDAQLARRIVHVHLTRQVEWEESLKTHSIKHPADFRTSSEIHANIANAILSEVIDEFFQQPAHFENIAESLGFQRLSKSAEAVERNKDFTKLFLAACRTIDEPYREQKGWKLIRQELKTDLSTAWQEVCDPCFTTSRRCSEVDWMKILDAKEPIIFESRPINPQKVLIRFKGLESKLLNEELT